MRFALSTNWNNGRLDDGAAIADEAAALGFDALELGFRTTAGQLAGFKRRLDQMPVDSIHAYCPVPMGAPGGHPELHKLADLDADERAMARLLMRQTLDCAREMGARVVVAHAGYVNLDGWFINRGTDALDVLLKDADGKADATRPAYVRAVAKARVRRARRGRRLLAAFTDELAPVLEDFAAAGVTLALENLPSLEGFPNAEEAETLMRTFAGAPLKLWFDTGHARVRECHLWADAATDVAQRLGDYVCGIHLNDVKDFHDDHRQPGWGNVDFAALASLAQRDVVRVFEPKVPVTADELKCSLEYIRTLWTTSQS